MPSTIYDRSDVDATEHTIADLATHDYNGSADTYDGEITAAMAARHLNAWDCPAARSIIADAGGIAAASEDYRDAWRDAHADEYSED